MRYKIYMIEGDGSYLWGQTEKLRDAHILAASFWSAFLPFKGWGKDNKPSWWFQIEDKNGKVVAFIGGPPS